MIDVSRHPCFDEKARHTFGRVHLPVAPACNVQCRFCNRRFDCANESRPGVTSAVLTPAQALAYLKKVTAGDHRISVVGIAGPGDPFANADETMQTLRLVRQQYPEMILCVASNGLGIAPHIAELAELKTSHVTITVNADTPETAANVYAWVRDGYRPLRGIEAGQAMLDRQHEAVSLLKSHGITVKINTILIPTVNEHQIDAIARRAKSLGADVINVIPMIPVQGSDFVDLGSPCGTLLEQVRSQAQEYLPLMKHCARCRADAAGLIHEGTSNVHLKWMEQAKSDALIPAGERPYVAVASMEGMLVNQHLGEASELWVYGKTAQGDCFELVDRRPTPPTGSGAHRWLEMARRLPDCKVILTSGAGLSPRRVLEHAGLQVVMTEGLIQETLTSIYQGQPLRQPVRAFKCGTACSGTGGGCA